MDSQLLWGALDMLILEVLARGDNYGYQISQIVLGQSGGYLELKEGSMYPALHRLERADLVNAYWVDTEEGRRRKYYKLTAKGRKALRAKRQEWEKFNAAVSGVLGGQTYVITA